jgi:predicted transposase/invertase (TIGR01784 family)
MRFISPKTDFAFKKIFGSIESKNILISFLNSIIYQGQNTICDLEIIDPYNPAFTLGLKDTYLDVKARLDNDSTVIIEMQVINIASFEKRIVYNLAKTYANQLKSGQSYRHLQPVIALTITDFNLFENLEEAITFWVFKEQTKLIDYISEDLKMVFVELPKFKKKIDDLDTITDKWIYFLKEAPNLEIVPDKIKEVEEINQALTIANQANLTEKELDELHHQEVFLEDQKGSFVKGKQEGIEEGIEEGVNQGELLLVNRLLKRKFGELPPDLLSQIENLPRSILENLGEALLDFNSISDLVGWLNSN